MLFDSADAGKMKPMYCNAMLVMMPSETDVWEISERGSAKITFGADKLMILLPPCMLIRGDRRCKN